MLFRSLVKRVPKKEKEAVHEFVYTKETRELLFVYWDGRQYYLRSSSGYRRKSTITEVGKSIQVNRSKNVWGELFLSTVL